MRKYDLHVVDYNVDDLSGRYVCSFYNMSITDMIPVLENATLPNGMRFEVKVLEQEDE